MMPHTLRYTALSAALLVALPVAAEKAPDAEQLWKIIQQQQQQIKALQQQIQQTDQKVEATAEAVEQSEASVASVAEAAKWFNKTTLGGYGEVLYNNNTTSDGRKEIDVQRFIFYIGHEFSDDIRFFSETEIEHTNTARDGEVELEQAYIEWDYADNHSFLAGLYLVPVGIINETHEPDTFYGVERNRIESRIIPTTYRVNGIKFAGEIAPGLRYDLGIHEGLQLTDNLSIRSSRQSGSRSNADELAATGRIKYTGIQGLELGLAFQYQSDLLQDGEDNIVRGSDSGIASEGAVDALLTEVHGIYKSGPLELRALYARWDLDDAITDVVTSDTTGAGRDEQFGWYIEPSYKVTEQLGLFTRYEYIDERAGSDGGNIERRTLLGANYWLHPNVVFKADIQFEDDTDRDGELDGFNLGVGWSF